MPSTVPDTATGLGLEPDVYGNVRPLIWVTRHEESAPGYNTKTNVLDLFVAAESDWVMPFDTNSDLLNAIGAENIRYYPVSVRDFWPVPIVLIRIEGIRLGDAIHLFAELDATEIVTTNHCTSCGATRIVLDGSPETYSAALVYDGEALVATIELD